MSISSRRLDWSRSVLGTLLVSGLAVVVLFVSGRKDYPNLHTILDTAILLLTGILALLLWDMGERTNNPFPKHLAISFAVATLLNFIHVMVTVEWSGPLLPIAEAKDVLRPGTWPPSTHVLPFGVGCSIWLMRRKGRHAWALAIVLMCLSVGLLAVFGWLPRYSPPVWLGITRPTLILSPVLWAVVGWGCWRLLSKDRLIPMLGIMSIVLFLANAAQLYSRAPHDNQAMVAHLGRVCGYLVLLVSAMRMAAEDMRERIRAERELKQLNEQLEQRVLDRTALLNTTSQSLRENQERTRAIIDAALDGIITMNHEGRIMDFNPAAERIFDHRSSEAVGQMLADLIIPPALREQHQRGLSRYLATGEGPVLGRRVELTALRASGTEFPVELSITRVGSTEPPLFTGFVRDITERKLAEEKLRKSEARFSAVFRSGPMAMSINAVVDGRLIDANDQYCEFFGYSRSEIIGRSVLELKNWVNPEERASVIQRLLKERAIRGLEVKQRRRSGEVRDVLASLELIELAGESEPVLISMFTDITERKRIEEVRAQLAAVVESSDDAIISTKLDGAITSWNRGAEKLFGYSFEGAVGKSMRMLFPPERRKEETEIITRTT